MDKCIFKAGPNPIKMSQEMKLITKTLIHAKLPRGKRSERSIQTHSLDKNFGENLCFLHSTTKERW